MRNPWTLAKVWNDSIDKSVREYPPRDYMWASELGRADIDIWLKMQGEKPTNPPNDRSFRKFAAGNWFEWGIKQVLISCGLLQSCQDRVECQPEGCVRVSGKLDFVAGGRANYAQARATIAQMFANDELLLWKANKVIDGFEATNPLGWDEKVLEIKSCALITFNRIEKTGKPLAGHDLQLFHYAFTRQQEGALIYLCRDDMRMYEIPIMPNDQMLLAKYTEKVKRVSGYYLDQQMPEPEKPVVFDEDLLRFQKNFNVEYSPFLTKIYNIENPDAYDEMYSKRVASWNRVLGRVATKAKMTPKNLEALADMQNFGFDKDRIINLVQTRADELAEAEEGEE